MLEEGKVTLIWFDFIISHCSKNVARPFDLLGRTIFFTDLSPWGADLGGFINIDFAPVDKNPKSVPAPFSIIRLSHLLVHAISEQPKEVNGQRFVFLSKRVLHIFSGA